MPDLDAIRARLAQGVRLQMLGMKQRFTVRAAGKRYVICTKPFNAKKTVIYTILDLQEGVQGTENLIFGMGFETDEQCAAALERLESGETRVSHRNRVEIDWVALLAALDEKGERKG